MTTTLASTWQVFEPRSRLTVTTLAWVRTTLGMASFGFGMVAFFRTLEERTATPRAIRLHHGAILIGASLMVVGIVATVLAGASHWTALRRLRAGKPPDHQPLAPEHHPGDVIGRHQPRGTLGRVRDLTQVHVNRWCRFSRYSLRLLRLAHLQSQQPVAPAR